MSTSDGAKSADDLALSGALAEMQSEGTIDSAAPLGDLGSPSTSHTGSDASAADASAQPLTGDDGSSPAARSTPDAADPKTLETGAAPAADPHAGSEPFTYTANGETKTLDGIRRVPGEGFYGDEAQAASLQALAERADTLDRVSRDVTAQNAHYERLSTWTVTDSEGKPQTLTGPQGLEAMRVGYARLESALSVVDTVLDDPARLLGLCAKDGQGNIVLDPSAVETLQMRIQLAAQAAETKARTGFAQSAQPRASSGPASYASSAPAIIEQSSPQHATLTAADRALLAEQIDRYVRDVTDEDRRWNPALKAGGKIVDAAFSKVVQHLVAQRASEKQVAQAAERAGKVNAGMERGRQPAKAPAKPAAPVTPPTKSPERKRPDWDGPLTTALAEMGIER